ncbi:MAG: 50S ribosomal protein L18 [Candidatus Micrarchaeota archaeon]
MAKATGPVYCVPFRRKRERRTDYRKRLALVKSERVRMIVRKTNKQVLIQFAEYADIGDKTLSSTVSNELVSRGWIARRNLPTAYLAGFLAGFKAKKAGVKEFVLDIGLQTPSKGALVFAAAKGAIDSGLKSSMGSEVIDEARIKGEHIASFAKNLKESTGATKVTRFSSYSKAGVTLESLPELFEKVKGEIKAEFGGN